METDKIIRELEQVIEKHKGKQVGVGETRIDLLAEDCLSKIRELSGKDTFLEEISIDRETCMALLEENELYVADGLEDALIGLAEGPTYGPVALYDREKVIRIFMERDGMTHEDAEEFFEYNTARAYVSPPEKTPIYARIIRG